MPKTLNIPATELPKYPGCRVKGQRGTLREAAVVQPGGDIVYARFDGAIGYGETTFQPSETLVIEIDD